MTESDFDDALLWSFASGFDDNAPNINLYQTSDFLRKDLLLAVGNVDESSLFSNLSAESERAM